MRTALLLTIAAAFGAISTPDDEKDLLGTWVVVSAERGGQKTEAPEGDKLILENGKIRIVSHVAEAPEHKGTYKIDSTKSPKSIDLIPDPGEKAEAKEFPAIYELKGDELRLCIPGPDEERPKEFKSPAESKTMIMVLKRQKP